MGTGDDDIFTTADGLRLHGEWYGPADGSPVVLLHGDGETRRVWNATAATLADAGYRVLTYDARGHGESDGSPDADVDLLRLADDLKRVIEVLDRPPAVVGASMGGRSALLAQRAEQEQLFSAVVLVDVTPETESRGVAEIRDLMLASPDGFGSLDEAAVAIDACNPPRRQSASSDLHQLLARRSDGRWVWRQGPRLVAGSNHWERATDAFGTQVEETAERSHVGARRLDVPTLLIRNAWSDVMSDASVQEFLAAMPDASYVDFADAGHTTVGGDDRAVGVAVVDFFIEHVGADPARSQLVDCRRQAAGAIRKLGHAMAEHMGTPETLDRVTRAVEAEAAALRATARRDHVDEMLSRRTPGRPRRRYGPITFAGSSPVGGAESAFAIDVRYRVNGDQLIADAVIGPGFQGPPGRAHGGTIAGLVDETMAALIAAHGFVAFTTQLELRYVAAAPLEVPLNLRAWVEHVDGSQIEVQCTGSCRGSTFVIATATFRQIDVQRLVTELGCQS